VTDCGKAASEPPSGILPDSEIRLMHYDDDELDFDWRDFETDEQREEREIDRVLRRNPVPRYPWLDWCD